MPSKKLFAVLESLYPLSPSFEQALSASLTLLSLPKDYHLLEAPRVSEHLYFLVNGFAFTYHYAEGLKEVDRFWDSESLILSVESFVQQKPSMEYIQLASPCEVLFISHSRLAQLSDSYAEVHYLYRHLLYRECLFGQERIHDLLHLTARARYQKTLADFKKVEQLVTQGQLASYLGITPQSLSRIKRNER